MSYGLLGTTDESLSTTSTLTLQANLSQAGANPFNIEFYKVGKLCTMIFNSGSAAQVLPSFDGSNELALVNAGTTANQLVIPAEFAPASATFQTITAGSNTADVGGDVGFPCLVTIADGTGGAGTKKINIKCGLGFNNINWAGTAINAVAPFTVSYLTN